MTRSAALLAVLVLALASACFRDAAPEPAVRNTTSPVTLTAATVTPSVSLITRAEWEACEDATPPTLDNGLDPQFYCEGQSLEGSAPLRYRHLPAIAADGSALAVVEERDGWGHIPPGLRILDRDGRSLAWLPLDGTGDVAEDHVAKANAVLAERAWLPLVKPAVAHRVIDDDHSETTVSIGDYTATYARTNQGDYWLPPSRITVTDAKGRMIASRTDTERAWHAPPRCNLPSFELVGAHASPGVLLFRTGLGMGGHNCDGVVQPPTWHVLAFGAR